MDIPKNNKQNGFSLIEVAYVLPLIMVLILALVEAVNYTSDRYYLNNALSDFYAVVMAEAQQRSADPAYHSPLVKCDQGRVRVNEERAEEVLKQMVLSVVPGKAGDLAISTQKRVIMGIDTYVVDVSMPMRTRFLPKTFEQTFPLRAKLLMSFTLSCRVI